LIHPGTWILAPPIISLGTEQAARYAYTSYWSSNFTYYIV
jgi:hypothetical protein